MTTNAWAGMTDDERAEKRRRLIAQVEKLLALSESANEHEAAVATQKVQELLEKYNLDMGEIKGRARSVDERMGIVRIPFISGGGRRGSTTMWEVQLAGVVARNFFCDILVSRVDVVFFGTEINLEIATYTYAQIANLLHAMSAKARTDYVRRTKADYEARGIIINPDYRTNQMGKYDPYCLRGAEHPNNFRVSWLDGAVVGVATKLREEREAFARTGGGAALVRDMSAALEAFRREQFPHLYNKKGEMTGKGFKVRDRDTNYDAYTAGYDAGKALDVKKGLRTDARDGAPALRETKALKG